jgi:hypothetical protein
MTLMKCVREYKDSVVWHPKEDLADEGVDDAIGYLEGVIDQSVGKTLDGAERTGSKRLHRCRERPYSLMNR